MRVCVPVKEYKGLESVAYNHFGSAPYFLIYNSETEEIKVIENGDSHHAHGMCQPLKAIGGEHVDAILVGGIGSGALKKLSDLGIKAYRVANKTVSENIDLLIENKLVEFSIEGSCDHHDCSH